MTLLFFCICFGLVGLINTVSGRCGKNPYMAGAGEAFLIVTVILTVVYYIMGMEL